MAKKKVLTPEQEVALAQEIAQESLVQQLKEINKQFETGRLPTAPTRLFKVGDQVQFGAWGTTHITEVLQDGLVYKLHADYIHSVYGKPTRIVQDICVSWIEVFPYVSKEENDKQPILHDIDDVRLTYYNNTIDSLLHKVYHAGVDFNPDYQRDLVWSPAQKVALIESIFTNVDIGKFTFIQHDYDRDFFYEILDGKQRLTTLLEFYEGRFKYKGKTYAEMSFSDKHHFTGHAIVQGDINNITPKQIYKLFIKMNTSGTPVDPKHLDKIKQLYKDAK